MSGERMRTWKRALFSCFRLQQNISSERSEFLVRVTDKQTVFLPPTTLSYNSQMSPLEGCPTHVAMRRLTWDITEMSLCGAVLWHAENRYKN